MCGYSSNLAILKPFHDELNSSDFEQFSKNINYNADLMASAILSWTHICHFKLSMHKAWTRHNATHRSTQVVRKIQRTTATDTTV